MINILITAAGAGKRFQKYCSDPKPFIMINGQRMISLAIQDLVPRAYFHDYQFIFVFLNEHIEKYREDLNNICTKLCCKHTIIGIDKITNGAAQTALLAEKYINNNNPLIISDCDHICKDIGYIQRGIDYFLKYKFDGGFYNFISNDPKYSYIKVNDKSVSEVQEKITISNLGNVGVYYYKNGSMFVKYATEIISKDIRTKGEYYISTVATPAIIDGANFGYFLVNDFIGLGTPKDLENFINNEKK